MHGMGGDGSLYPTSAGIKVMFKYLQDAAFFYSSNRGQILQSA
jgi:hypothetical protein